MAKSTTSITSTGDGNVADFLEKIRGLPPVARDGKRGKLIFAMDATMSRQPSWDRALSIQSEMFAETARIGGLDVQLVYFRGFNECRASKWVSNPTALARLMTTVDCRGGNTQIGRALCQAAGEIGLQGTPIFTFQEGNDPNAARAFQEIAKLSRGAYFKLNESSAHMLRELLSAVAVYAAGGRAALEHHARARGGNSTLLLQQLK
jgi:hypothetical protein